jgi:hypothetical protein
MLYCVIASLTVIDLLACLLACFPKHALACGWVGTRVNCYGPWGFLVARVHVISGPVHLMVSN